MHMRTPVLAAALKIFAIIAISISSSTIFARASPNQTMEFRIRTDIYTDQTKPPATSIQTMFTNGQYIEWDEEGGRCTVFDPSKSRITLMDVNKKQLVHLEMQVVENKLNEALKQLDNNATMLFTSDGETKAEPQGYFSIGNQWQRYYFKPLATPQNIAASYGDYANWSVRINALYPPRLPPQMRLQLNELLIGQSQIPEETRRVRTKDGVVQEVTAKLILTQNLAANDRSRVATIYKWMQEFKPTTDDAFFK